MNQKDYVIIGDALARGRNLAIQEGIYHETADHMLETVLTQVCISFLQENREFDAERFCQYVWSRVDTPYHQLPTDSYARESSVVGA